MDDGPGDCDALFLSSRELGRAMVSAVAEADEIEGGENFFLSFALTELP